MEQKKKTRLFRVKEYEGDTLRYYLEEMAKDGWLLDSFHGNEYVFYQYAPRCVTYQVDVNIYEGEDEAETISYVCENGMGMEEQGWQLVDYDEKFLIFRTEAKVASAVCLDQKKRYKKYNKWIRNNTVCLGIMNIILGIGIILNWYMRIGSVGHYNFRELYAILWSFIIFEQMGQLISYFDWRRKSKAQYKDHKVFRLLSYRWTITYKIVCIGCMSTLAIVTMVEYYYHVFSVGGIGLAIVAGALAVAAGVFIFFALRKQKNVSRCAINLRDGGYLFISVVVFVFVMVLCFSDLNLSDNNSLPITLEQLGLWDDNEEFSLRETSVESQPALFAKVTEYTDCIEKKDGAQSYIRYTIVKSRFSSILEKYKAGGYTYLAPVLLGEKQSIRDDRWDAKRVIEFTFNDDKCLLIIYEDTLLWINRDGLSDEQVAVFRNFIKK